MVLASLIIGLLIVLTALYVAAEFAAVAARRSRMRRLADDGSTLAGRMLPILDDARELDRYIAASQVGITLSSLILGAYGQAALAPAAAPLLEQWLQLAPADAETAAAAAVLLVLTTLAMILGELVPKSLALNDPTQVALITVVPMQWSVRLFGFSIKFLNGSGNLILRLLRVPSSGHRHVHSPEELDLLIAESRDGGLLEPEEQRRLHHALGLARRPASQLMVPRDRIAALDVELPIAEVRRLIATSPYSRLIVYRGSLDQIVGMLHTKDVVLDMIRESPAQAVQPLVRQLPVVPESMAADRVLSTLRERRSHQALVTGSDGRVAGLITLEDVLTELLGGVPDEFKHKKP